MQAEPLPYIGKGQVGFGDRVEGEAGDSDSSDFSFDGLRKVKGR